MGKIIRYGKNNLLSYIILILLSIFFLAPLYVIINCSLKSFAEASPSYMWNLAKKFNGIISQRPSRL